MNNEREFKDALKRVLDSHAEWLKSLRSRGKRASLRNWDLRGANLQNANLRDADLRNANLCYASLWNADLQDADLQDAKLDEANLQYANLRGADLQDADLQDAKLDEANLQYANLRGANLRGAYLYGVNLQGAILYDTDLQDANLCGANLRGANLQNANLRGANLRGANLYGADLRGADLQDVDVDAHTVGFFPTCPEEGAFIGWKKAAAGYTEYIVKLRIPEDARRSSATTVAGRCDKAEVLGIYNLDGSVAATVKSVPSLYTYGFKYRVGETVEARDFDPDRWAEYAPGIHFFPSFEAAKHYYI